MTSHMRAVPIRSLFRHAKSVVAAVAVAGVAFTVACSPSEILEVNNPDIISPSEVNSPAGARAVRVGARKSVV